MCEYVAVIGFVCEPKMCSYVWIFPPCKNNRFFSITTPPPFRVQVRSIFAKNIAGIYYIKLDVKSEVDVIKITTLHTQNSNFQL